MARKLSFSVESILNDQVSISTSIHKNDSSRDLNQLVEERVHEFAFEGPCHQRSYSSSVVPMGLQRLPTPPSSPLSTASAPSPATGSPLDDNAIEIQSDGVVETDESSPSLKTSHSSRKGRLRFSPEQIQALEQRFQEQQYLLPADRKMLAVTLRMTERQVKTWFQNKRAQFKRSRHLSQYPSLVSNMYSFQGPALHPALSLTPLIPRVPAFPLPLSPFPLTEQKQLFLGSPHSPVVMGTPRIMYPTMNSPTLLPH